MAEWIDMAASIFACIGVAIALVNLFQLRKTYLATHERTCKQTTIEFFNELKKESEEIEKKLFLKYGLEPIHLDELDEETLLQIKQYLSLLERFSLGVNLGVYDLIVADRMSGSFFINTYYQLQPFILDIRKKRFDNRLYEEFEHMKNELEKIRSTFSEIGGEIKHSPTFYNSKSLAKTK